MTTEINKIKKLHKTLEQAIKEVHALRKCTKETEVIFLQALEAHEKTAKMMRNLLEARLVLQKIYGK
jgi:hypothetical protein